VILIDTTIVNVAIPTMIVSLHAGVDQILWVVNGFLLAFAVLLVTGGRLGDIFGQRNLFATGMAIFTMSSVLCGLAQDANQLIVARVLQGVGAATLMPQTTALISAIFAPDRRGAAFGYLSGVAGLAGISGPIAGGLIVDHLAWRWIFFINVPIGLAAIALTFAFVPDLRPGRKHRLDLVGVLLATAGLGAWVYALVEGQRYNWGPTILGLMIGGTVLLGLFLLWERSQSEPLLPLALFGSRNFSILVWLMALMNAGLFGMLIATTLDLQSVLGQSPVQAGLTLAPLAFCAMVASPLTGRLTDRVGGRYIIMLGFVLAASAVGAAAMFESLSSTSLTFVIPLGLLGAGMGCVFAPLATEAMREVQPVMAGAASGLLNSSRQLGSAVGIALVGAVLQNRLAIAFQQTHGYGAAFTSAMHPSLALAAGVLALGAVSCTLIRRKTAPAVQPVERAVASEAA
jgi:EmrB/QacA subfamily drug resistance transporter